MSQPQPTHHPPVFGEQMTQPGLIFSSQLLAGLLGARACISKSSLATSQTLSEKNVTGDLEYQHHAKAVHSLFPARAPKSMSSISQRGVPSLQSKIVTLSFRDQAPHSGQPHAHYSLVRQNQHRAGETEPAPWQRDM